MHQSDNNQAFFEELGPDQYHEELPEYIEPETVGLSDEAVRLLHEDIMNPMPPTEQNNPN